MATPTFPLSVAGEIHKIALGFQKQLSANQAEANSKMLRGYAVLWRRAKALLDKTKQEIADLEAAGLPVDEVIVWRRERYESILQQIGAALKAFAEFANKTVVMHEQMAIDQAKANMEGYVSYMEQAAPTWSGISQQYHQVPNEALKYLVGTMEDGSPLTKLLQDVSEKTFLTVRKEFETGMALGEGPEAIAKRIRPAMGDNLIRSLRIARTETARAYRGATLEYYRANAELVPGWRWLSAKTPRTCASCLAMDGSWHSLAEHLDDHPNGRCVPAGTLVAGATPVSASSRDYTGKLVTIRTTSGTGLTLTPNHPVLTPYGWVAGGLLREGDYVVCGPFCQGAPSAIDEHDNNVPARIEDVLKAFRLVVAEMPCSSKDFNGDGEGSKVYVVRANCLLRYASKPSGSEPVEQHGLGPGCPEDAGLASEGDLAAMLESLFPAPCGLLGGCNAELPLLWRESCGNKASGRSLSPDLDLGGEQAIDDGPAGDSELVREDVHRGSVEIGANDLLGWKGDPAGVIRPLGVVVERVVSTRVRMFSGHVYSLQTDKGWYIAGDSIAQAAEDCGPMGVVTKNCDMVPALMGEDGAPLPAGWQTGSEWLAEQPETVQKRILGRGGYGIYKEGNLTLRDWVSRKTSKAWGSTRTAASLEELQKRNQAAIIKKKNEADPDYQKAKAEKAAADKAARLALAAKKAKEAEEKAKAEAEALAKAKAEAEAKAKLEAEAKALQAKLDAEAKAKAEAESKAQTIANGKIVEAKALLQAQAGEITAEHALAMVEEAAKQAALAAGLDAAEVEHQVKLAKHRIGWKLKKLEGQAPKETKAAPKAKGLASLGASARDVVLQPMHKLRMNMQELWGNWFENVKKRLKLSWSSPWNANQFSSSDMAGNFKKATMLRLNDKLSEPGPFRELVAWMQLQQKGYTDKVHEPTFRALFDTMSTGAGYGATAGEQFTSGLIHNWAISSADKHPLSLALQKVAAEMFGLPVPKHFDKTAMAIGDKLLGQTEIDVRGALRQFIQAQYDLTQQDLKEAGVDELFLFRGMGLAPNRIGYTNTNAPDFVSGFVGMDLQPISSFSSSYRVSSGSFSNSQTAGHYSSIWGTSVPRERILGMPSTGFGCLNEQEYIVIGGRGDMGFVAAARGGRSIPYDADQFYREMATAVANSGR